MLVYSVASKPSFEMVRVLRDKILNHLVLASFRTICWTTAGRTATEQIHRAPTGSH